jgi:transcriptional regulator with XRE-family HTH domain
MVNLLVARKRKNLTQKELGDKVGVNNLKISRYERGETIPKADVLKRIATTLGVSMEYLLGGEEDKNISTSQSKGWGQ